MQQLNVNLSIPIPSDHVLIAKVELEELQQSQLHGVYWNMKDLENRTGRKIDWLKSNVLYPPHFEKKLNAKYGGFVYYPTNKGQAWSFHAAKMADFLNDNFHLIFGEEVST